MKTHQAERLQEIVAEMTELLNEFKQICRQNMEPNQYQDFKYRTLGHIEPALMEETEWVTTYSSIESLEKVAQSFSDEAEDNNEEED